MAAAFHDGGEVGLQLLGAVEAVAATLGGEDRAGDELGHSARPVGDLLPVLLIEAQDVRRHADGERLAEVVDAVDPPPGRKGATSSAALGGPRGSAPAGRAP
ncbi:hypothetical protein GCM10009663_52020 [Kitasatospora arboriphila]|uniref:Uncharacterized protein n=1 Tax=Kitasatospora arboriphila TaxID=258052 RepID=A0ABN1TVW9_9ACTN